MPTAPPARRLYTHRAGLYQAMVWLLRCPQGLARFFANALFLRPDMKVLDAGCGTGAATLALHAALTQRGWRPAQVDAFDVTLSMLSRLRKALQRASIAEVELAVADIQHLDTLPAAWQDYDLIVSSAMLEYLPRATLPAALQGLRQRLRGGHAGRLHFPPERPHGALYHEVVARPFVWKNRIARRLRTSRVRGCRF